MLAEPRRKQKWSLNPRGKHWAQDTNKFGQKLMEKMGWSQGKGLGAKEDGMVEHIKVSHKNDSKGIGYKESDDQWTAHESNFSALLEALGGDTSTEIKLNSLEEKSQKSRARVHYKKFTRGKDISKYSEKDLANIFGKKSIKELKKSKKDLAEQEEKSVKSAQNETNDSNKPKNSDLFSHGGLMSDYFKKKLPNFGKGNGYVVGNNGVLKKADDSESESEMRPSFGFGFSGAHSINKTTQNEELCDTAFMYGKEESKVGSTFTSYVYEGSVENTPEKKKNKKKRNIDEEVEEIPTKKKRLESSKTDNESPIKSKKGKLKRKQPNEEEKGLSNPAFNPLNSPIKIEKHILEPIEESSSENLNDTVGQVAENFEVTVQINNESTPVKKRSEEDIENESIKKRKKKKGISQDINISYTTEDSAVQTEIKNKKKKKSKTKEECKEMDTSSLNESNYSEENCIESETKKEKKKKTKTDSIKGLDFVPEDTTKNSKKKKSKTKNAREGVDNPFFNMSIESEESMTVHTENPYEIRIKEKKKKRSKKEKENYALENPVFDEDDSLNSQDFANEDFEVIRKDKSKKKKSKKEENKGLDNPALNLNDSIDTVDDSCDLMLNIATTPIITKEPKNTLNETISIKKVNGVKRRKSVRFSDVTRERIIPMKEELEQETLEDSQEIVEIEGKLNDSAQLSAIDKFIQKQKIKKSKKRQGVDNSAFDKQVTSLEENITSISNTLDTYQAEIENDMNEAKLKSVEIGDIMVGEVGNPNGTNEILPDGTVKLKFKDAKFKKTASYLDSLTGSKKSYKHLIKGDVIMKFKETNLHEIEGYAVKLS